MLTNKELKQRGRATVRKHYLLLLAPALDTLLMRINTRILIPVTVVFMSLFCADAVYSQFVPNIGTGITDMGTEKNTPSG